MLKNASFLAIVAVHTAENESQQVSSVLAEKLEKIRPYLISKVLAVPGLGVLAWFVVFMAGADLVPPTL